MYLYISLIGWILGISWMGRNVPEYLHLMIVFCVVFFLLLQLCNFLKWSLSQTFIFKVLSVLLFGLSSFFVAIGYADSALEQRLALRDIQTQSTEHIVYIENINKIKEKYSEENTQAVNSFAVPKTIIQQKMSIVNSVEKVQLLSYLNQEQVEILQLGHYYRVQGQVKPVHGFAVAGVFDKEKWMLQENLLGILKIQSLEVLSEQEVKQLGYARFIEAHEGGWAQLELKIEKLRLHFRTLIADSSLNNQGLVLALLTGDESLLGEDTQALFKKLGIAHLLAISGPHVLIFAILCCFMFTALVKRFYVQLYLKIPRPYLLVLPFLSCVMLYTAFVGFEIPAMRTMFTVFILSIIILFKQKIQPLKHLLMTASLLLWVDPFSILSVAFWLSFGACLILLRVYQILQHHHKQQKTIQNGNFQHQNDSKNQNPQMPTGFDIGLNHAKLYFRVLFDSQWKIFIALMPLVLWIFQQFSWVTPLTNLIAIPMIGALIVPLEVLASCISLFSDHLAVFVFKIADVLLSILVSILDWMDQVLNFHMNWWAFTPLQLLCLGIAILIVFLPRGVLPKLWAVICLVPLFMSNKASDQFQLNILDVAQGQAIFLNLPHYKMMIDVGGVHDESHFGIGKNVIIPYLSRQGISQLDHVLLTHLDQDHSGAYSEVAKVIKIKQVQSNERDARFDGANFSYCHQGQYWQYDGVKITVLSPPENSLSQVPNHQNELSCVLYIQVPESTSYQNFLLMGDAGWETEFNLLQQYPDLKVDVLVLGHHGSHNSSAYAFLKQLKPKLAIASVGYANRYGHPHPLVLKRLKVLGIPLKTMIEQGSIQFSMDAQGQMQVHEFRQTRKWLRFSNGFNTD